MSEKFERSVHTSALVVNGSLNISSEEGFSDWWFILDSQEIIFFVLLTRSCKLLLVVNEDTLSWAAGGKVRGQTAGDCGGSNDDINTIAV